MSAQPLTEGRWAALGLEARKLPAFLRRDFLVNWSYRLAFVTDWLSMIFQVLIFYFVGRLVNPATLPTFGGQAVTYMEFVVLGIALTSFVEIGLGRVVSALRNEQLIGTLESLLVSPSAWTTLQLGFVVYDVVYVPLRMLIFIGLVSLLFPVEFTATGLGPAAGILIVFIPLVWGLGMISAAGVLTFRRGFAVVGFGGLILTIASGTYFPVEVLPGWLQPVARANPITIALDAVRESMLGQAGWSEVWPAMLALLPMAAGALALGIVCFRLALRRERRLGTIGLY